MRLNKKGFTLIELLVTIVIVGLVIGFSVYGIIQFVGKAEERKLTISKKNIKESARIYAGESSDNSWKVKEDYEYFCVTVGELINKGLLNKDALLSGGVKRNDFVAVKRNKTTLAIENEEILGTDHVNYSICTNEFINEDEDLINPVIKDWINYTDQIEISFEKGSSSYNGVESSITYRCLYGETSNNINTPGIVNDNKCIMEGLKNNKDYYAMIYMDTANGSSVVAIGDIEYYTSNFKEPVISQNEQNKNVVNITYYDKDNNGNLINSPKYYFKSNIKGETDVEVEKCELDGDFLTCSGSNTNIIDANSFYKTSSPTINITYPEEENNVEISARIYDGSNNHEENIQKVTIKKYIVKFYKNTASSIEGNTSEYIEKYCITDGKSSCKIVSPNAEANVGNTFVGWNTEKDAISSKWYENTSKDIKSNQNYYAITRLNKVYINYSVNGGIIKETTAGGSWTTDNAGLIYKNGNLVTKTINYDSNDVDGGLANYNNPDWINISREGYTAPSGDEWICLSGNCEFDTYSQADAEVTGYDADIFCVASSGDCTVVLGVNWELNKYTIEYDATDGEGAPGNQIKIHDDDLKLSDNIPTKKGHKFTGWNTKKDGSGISYDSGDLYTDNKSITLYAQWTKNKIYINYSVNGGNISSSNKYSWTTSRYREVDGVIFVDGSPAVTVGEYDSFLEEGKGLFDYNNTDWINISRDGYNVKSGEEWICLSGCGNNNYKPLNQKTGYNTSFFCNAEDSNCTVIVGVNWKLNEYTINYDANYDSNDGTDVPGSQNKTHDNDLVLSNTKPTRKGYKFSNWNTKKDGSGTTYKPGEVYSENESVTLYAQWTKNKIYINYSVNNGIVGQNLSDKNTHSWTTATYREVDGVIFVDGSPAVTVGEYGGTLEEGKGLFDYNNPDWINISRDGYNVKSGEEWICLSGCGNNNYKPLNQKTGYNTSFFCNAEDSNCTVIVGVNWKANVYSPGVTYNANGGTGAPNSQDKTYDVDLVLSSTKPTKTGYTFVNWNTEKNGTGTTYNPGDTYSENKSITLYAQWSDSNKPSASITTTNGLKQTSQTATLKCSDNVGIVGYYWGTSVPSSSTIYTSVTSTTSMTETKTVNSSGTYYLSCKDSNGNVSNNVFKTYYSYTVNNMLQRANDILVDGVLSDGVSGIFTTTNYSKISSATYIGVSGTNLVFKNIYTVPSGSNSSNFKKASTGTPGTTAPSKTYTSDLTLNNNIILNFWFDRNKVFIYYSVQGGTVGQNLASTNTHTWTVDTYDGIPGVIHIDGIKASTTGLYDGALTKNGLSDYDNSKWINISKTGYIAKFGEEWKCLKGCGSDNGATFDDSSAYNTSEFCDAKYGNCAVILGVNWIPKSIGVTFSSNCGAVSPTSKNVTYNSTYGDLPEPTRTGYTFNGWYTATSGGTKTSSTTKVTNPSNHTLYARCSANSYTVTFDANEGTVSKESMTVTYNSTYGDLPTPTNKGHTFNGWYTAKSGGTKIISSNTVTTASNHTLYAHWTAKTPTVTFDANGGTVTTKSTTVTYNSTYGTLPTPTWEGRTFNGWYTAKTGGTKIISSSTVTNPSNHILYAHWTINKVYIKYSVNGGTITSKTTTESDVINYWTTNNNGIIKKNGNELINSINFSGKTVDEHLANYNNSEWINITKTGYTGKSGEEWKLLCINDICNNNYSQKFNQNKEYNASDFCDASSESCTVILGVNWTPREYTVTFNANGGSVSPTSKIVTYNSTYGTLPTPTYEGHTFNGWYTALSGGTKVESSTKVSITSNQTLYARWTPREYTVTFDATGGSVSPTSKIVTYNSTYGTLPTPTWEGRTFKGWYTAKNSGTKITSSSTVTNASNHTLYAHWTINQVTIKYSVNGGTVTKTTNGGTWTTKDGIIYRDIGDGPVLYKSTINYNGQTTGGGLPNYNSSEQLKITKTGIIAYKGQEWKCIEGCTGSKTIFSQAAATEVVYNASDFCDVRSKSCTVVLGVNWDNTEYKITYNANGTNASNIPSQQTKTSGVNVTLSSKIPTRTDYIFKGWNTKADGSGTSYTPGEKYSTNANVTLYAQWEKHTEHTWEATGNTIFTLYEKAQFTCDKYHIKGYARYCSVCGMSVRYYREQVNTSSKEANWWCPCEVNSISDIEIRFNDSSLYSSDAKTGRDNVENRCGLTCGQPLFEPAKTVTTNCTEH